MKILQLCNRVPYPLKDGGSIAMYNMTKFFHLAGAEVTLLAMNTSKHFIDPQKLPEALTQYAKVSTIFVDNEINSVAAFLNLFTSRSYNIQRFISGDYEDALKELLQTYPFDVVQLEGLYLAPYVETIREHSDAFIAMRAHNVEFQIWERLAEQATGLKKWYMNLLVKRLKKFEVNHLNDYDALVPISPEDARQFKTLGCEIPVMVVPFGVDAAKYVPTPEAVDPLSIFFLGSLDWMPNLEGLEWLVQEVWPTLHQKYPTLKFHIAGRNMPAWVKELEQPGLVVAGEVEDAIEFMRSKAIMVVPLFSGSGMRVKIIEGMAMGKAVVSTSVGAEGITSTDQENILLADKPQEFINCISKLIDNQFFYDKISKNGTSLVRQQYDNRQLVRTLLQFYQDQWN